VSVISGLALTYNKTNSDFGLQATFYEPMAKKFNDNLDASHYLYTITSLYACWTDNFYIGLYVRILMKICIVISGKTLPIWFLFSQIFPCVLYLSGIAILFVSLPNVAL